MKSVLSDKLATENLIVLDQLVLDAPKTKDMIRILANLKADKKTLVVTAESNANVIRSASNIPKVETSIAGSLNVYDVINADTLVITQDAVRKIEEVLGNA